MLIDEAHLTSEQLGPLDNPVTAVFQLEQSEEIEQIRRVIQAVGSMALGEEAEQIRRDMAAWLRQVVLPAKLEGEELPEVEDLEEVDAMLAERVKTWPKKWMAEGYQAGRQEGLRESLGLLLERKFGRLSAAERRMVPEARQEQLTRWMERILEASSPAEVFQS
ncbi:MAG: hypothetical protein HC897_12215 [Thermoanaerobaculia bacterium]|nr:hypothetical protein [Thermoanaerobaculia bacterium]